MTNKHVTRIISPPCAIGVVFGKSTVAPCRPGGTAGRAGGTAEDGVFSRFS